MGSAAAVGGEVRGSIGLEVREEVRPAASTFPRPPTLELNRLEELYESKHGCEMVTGFG